MKSLKGLRFLFGVLLAGCFFLDSAHAQLFVSSVNGDDTQDCSRLSPCRFFGGALAKSGPGGQSIVVLDSGNFGSVVIDRSISIINGSETAVELGSSSAAQVGVGQIVIAAGANGAVTLRGLTFNGVSLGASAVLINNAQQVSIENCVIKNAGAPAILVAPAQGSNPSLANLMNVKIDRTVVTDSAGGVRITSVPGVTVTASISRSSFENNAGGGIRIDGTNGGTVAASISDTVSSMNAGNGIIAVSGPGGTAAAHITRSVMASNAAYGVQSNQTNGGAARVTVNSSTITLNASGAVGFFGGGTLLTAGNNLLVGGQGTGFSGPIALQ